MERLAIAELDYGNTPRATPLIAGEHVYCLGAHGHLLCIRLADGHVVWERNFRDDFPLQEDLPWGYCGSPLLVDNQLIVAPGAPEASLVALNPESGQILWKTPGAPPAYGSLNVGIFGGVKQIVGHDSNSLGGWDTATGNRIWKLTPKYDGDFNVPTPIIYDGKMLIVTENNGARLYEFQPGGQINPDPIASNARLHPDMSTPVVVGNRLFCVDNFLHCLDANDLQSSWRLRDPALGDYAAIIASDLRMLVVAKGELLLFATDGSQQIISRAKLFDERVNIHSHPALVDKHLYIRGESVIRCIQF